MFFTELLNYLYTILISGSYAERDSGAAAIGCLARVLFCFRRRAHAESLRKCPRGKEGQSAGRLAYTSTAGGRIAGWNRHRAVRRPVPRKTSLVRGQFLACADRSFAHCFPCTYCRSFRGYRPGQFDVLRCRRDPSLSWDGGCPHNGGGIWGFPVTILRAVCHWRVAPD